MKKPLLHLILCTAIVLPNAARAGGATETRAYDKTIENYVQFLQQHKQTPVDYIVSLFQTYDLVVLCERSHPEVTQYEMIYELAADQRFQQQAGHIFMENGTRTLQPAVEAFLTDDTLTEPQAQEKLRRILRDFHEEGAFNIPGLRDPQFAGAMLQRCRIKGESRSAAEIAKEIEQSQTVRTCGYEDKEFFPKSEYVPKIQQWLTAQR